MAHNSLIRGGVGSGAWTNYVVLHGVMEQLDQYVFQSINGDLGGTWAPAAIIIIGGAGLNVTGVFVADGAATFNALATFASNVVIQGNTTVWNKHLFDGAHSGEAQFNSGALLDGLAGSTFTWAGAATVSGSFTASGSTQLNGTTNVNATFNVLTGVAFSFDSGSVPTLNTYLAQGSSAAGIKHRLLNMPDANTTVTAGTYDRILIPTLSATRDLTLNDCPDGIEIIISAGQTGPAAPIQCNIKNQSGVLITALRFPDPSNVGFFVSVHLIRAGSAWTILNEMVYAVT